VSTGDEHSRGVLAGIRLLARDSLLGPLVLTMVVLDLAGAAITVTFSIGAARSSPCPPRRARLRPPGRRGRAPG